MPFMNGQWVNEDTKKFLETVNGVRPGIEGAMTGHASDTKQMEYFMDKYQDCQSNGIRNILAEVGKAIDMKRAMVERTALLGVVLDKIPKQDVAPRQDRLPENVSVNMAESKMRDEGYAEFDRLNLKVEFQKTKDGYSAQMLDEKGNLVRSYSCATKERLAESTGWLVAHRLGAENDPTAKKLIVGDIKNRIMASNAGQSLSVDAKKYMQSLDMAIAKHPEQSERKRTNNVGASPAVKPRHDKVLDTLANGQKKLGRPLSDGEVAKELSGKNLAPELFAGDPVRGEKYYVNVIRIKESIKNAEGKDEIREGYRATVMDQRGNVLRFPGGVVINGRDTGREAEFTAPNKTMLATSVSHAVRTSIGLGDDSLMKEQLALKLNSAMKNGGENFSFTMDMDSEKKELYNNIVANRVGPGKGKQNVVDRFGRSVKASDYYHPLHHSAQELAVQTSVYNILRENSSRDPKSEKYVSDKDIENYSKLIVKYADKHNVPPNVVAAFMTAESACRTNAVSKFADGSPCAYGLMQVNGASKSQMEWLSKQNIDGFKDAESLKNPATGIDAGCRILREKLTGAKGEIPKAAQLYVGLPGLERNIQKMEEKIRISPNQKDQEKLQRMYKDKSDLTEKCGYIDRIVTRSAKTEKTEKEFYNTFRGIFDDCEKNGKKIGLSDLFKLSKTENGKHDPRTTVFRELSKRFIDSTMSMSADSMGLSQNQA